MKRIIVFVIASSLVHGLLFYFIPKISPSRERVKAEDRIVVKLEFLKPQKVVKEEPKTVSSVAEPLEEKQSPKMVERNERKANETKAVDEKKITNKKTVQQALQRETKTKPETKQLNAQKETKKSEETPRSGESAEKKPQEAFGEKAPVGSLQVSERGNESEKHVFVSEEMVLKKVTPIYPLLARRKGLYGEVLLMVKLNKDGSIANIAVKKSSGYDILDKAALSAVKRWIFAPNIGNTVIVPVVFELK